LDPGIAPERCYLGNVNTARDSRATLVGVAVWFILFLLLFLIRRLTNGKVGVSRPVDVALVNAQRRVILSGEVAVANDRQSGLKDAAFIPAELPPLLPQVSIT
jgi:hypothetical protein